MPPDNYFLVFFSDIFLRNQVHATSLSVGHWYIKSTCTRFSNRLQQRGLQIGHHGTWYFKFRVAHAPGISTPPCHRANWIFIAAMLTFGPQNFICVHVHRYAMIELRIFPDIDVVITSLHIKISCSLSNWFLLASTATSWTIFKLWHTARWNDYWWINGTLMKCPLHTCWQLNDYQTNSYCNETLLTLLMTKQIAFNNMGICIFEFPIRNEM